MSILLITKSWVNKNNSDVSNEDSFIEGYKHHHNDSDVDVSELYLDWIEQFAPDYDVSNYDAYEAGAKINSSKQQIKSDITDADITVVRQGSKTKILDETPFVHIKKNLDAYLGNSPEDMWYLVIKPSGYELKGSGVTPDGVNTVWFKKKGAKDFALVFDANDELIDVKGAPARVFDSKKVVKSGKYLQNPTDLAVEIAEVFETKAH